MTPRLPKDVLADPKHEELQTLLASNATPLWEKGRVTVATLPPTRALSFELRRILSASLGTQGLEQIAKELEKEQKGLEALAKKTATTQNARISRILFLANDGSERFYRECESLLSRYEQRLIAVRLMISGEELGEVLFGKPKLARAVLVADKKAAARCLLSLLQS